MLVEQLLADPDVEIVYISLPNGMHVEWTRRDLEAGKHVLSEKPVAHDHHDVRRAAELARSKGLKTKVGLTFRYSPAVRYMKDLIARGDLGTPYI